MLTIEEVILWFYDGIKEECWGVQLYVVFGVSFKGRGGSISTNNAIVKSKISKYPPNFLNYLPENPDLQFYATGTTSSSS